MEIEITEDKAATKNTLEITLRGDPEKLALALANGLPREMLFEMWEALNVELQTRAESRT